MGSCCSSDWAAVTLKMVVFMSGHGTQYCTGGQISTFRRHLLMACRNGTSSDAGEEAGSTGKGRQGKKSCTGILQQRASLNNEHFFSNPTFLQEMLQFLI